MSYMNLSEQMACGNLSEHPADVAKNIERIEAHSAPFARTSTSMAENWRVWTEEVLKPKDATTESRNVLFVGMKVDYTITRMVMAYH
jgi:hypothetical protein